MKNRNILESFINAKNGILFAIKNERNMKIHVTIAVGVLIFSIYIGVTRMELAIICLVIGLVFICELINTVIETIVDSIIDEYDQRVKIVKDVAAGSVLVSACVAVIIAYFVYYDRIVKSLEKIITMRYSHGR